MINKIKPVLISLMSLFMVQNYGWAVGAGAFSTQMVGTKALGQGNAFVAQADDPSAVYFNPAGLTQLSGTQLSLGGDFLFPSVERSGAGVPDDKMKSRTSVIPNFYFTGHLPKLDDKWAFGLGLTSPYGLTTEWNNDSSVRYVTTVSKFELVNLNPSIAAKINSEVSIGVGIDYANLYNVESRNQLNLSAANLDGSADGTSELKGNGDGWGYNFGLLYKPVEKHSFGLSYRSKTHIAIDGDLKLSNLSGSTQANYNFSSADYSVGAKTSVVLPDSVLVGYAFNPSNKLTLLADYEWTRWSVFKNQDVTINESDPSRLGLITGDPSSNTIRVRRNWDDVSAIGLGANYKLNDQWQVRGGYGFFQKAVPTDTFSPDVPDAPAHLLTAGFSRSWTSIVLDFALNGWFYENRSVENTVGNNVGASVNGTYKTFIPSFAFNITYKI